MVDRKYVPARGDLVWVTLDPTRGHEQKGRCPALVITDKVYNAKAGMMLAVPITSKAKGYPFEVEVKGKVAGVAITDQIRCLDWQERKVKKIGRLSESAYANVEERLKLLILE